MSPVERETENRERHGERLRSTKEMTQEQPFAIQACSIAPMHDEAALLGQSAKKMLQNSGGVVREKHGGRLRYNCRYMSITI